MQPSVSARSLPSSPQALRVFSYAVAEKAPIYRAILRVFFSAKARFALHLRPREILQGVRSQGATIIDDEMLDAALAQLCEWGNLEAHPDTADVQTVEDFYRPRHLFQLSADGEAAERALQYYDEIIHQPGELQTAALKDIQVYLEELLAQQAANELDAGRVHRALVSLRDRFEQLTTQAQIFMGSLQRTIDLHGFQLEALLVYKQRLIEYLERFIGELVVSAADIADALRRFDRGWISELLLIAARRDVVDSADPAVELPKCRELWTARWSGLRAWFIGGPHEPSQADVLRSRARAAIPALLAAVAGLNERRVAKSDRVADLKQLALWFAECDNDHDAHRLWRAAFGLTPARHLRIDSRTLAEREERPVASQASWLHAPPISISPRLRNTGRTAKPGRAESVIDRTQEKAELARAAEAEARQIGAAQQRLAEQNAARLSDLHELDPREFDLFLDLLGEALSRQDGTGGVVEATSIDGTLRIRLWPTGDGKMATLRTRNGTLTGDDYFLSIWSPNASSPLGSHLAEAQLT